MTLSFNSTFWNSFLVANPSFAGFGLASSPVCILTDVFTAAPDADELEVMFRLERVNHYWKEKMEGEPQSPISLTYLPNYCHHYLDYHLKLHELNLAKESCFFVPLTIDFYQKSEQVWKDLLKAKLRAYLPLLSTFFQVHFASRFIEEKDFRAIFRNTPSPQLHFRQVPNS